jgi:hypothetical protein
MSRNIEDVRDHSDLFGSCLRLVRVEIVVDIVSIRNAKLFDDVYDLRCGRINVLLAVLNAQWHEGLERAVTAGTSE